MFLLRKATDFANYSSDLKVESIWVVTFSLIYRFYEFENVRIRHICIKAWCTASTAVRSSERGQSNNSEMSIYICNNGSTGVSWACAFNRTTTNHTILNKNWSMRWMINRSPLKYCFAQGSFRHSSLVNICILANLSSVVRWSLSILPIPDAIIFPPL